MDDDEDCVLRPMPRHEHTDVAPSPLNTDCFTNSRRAKSTLWDLTAEVPKWTPRAVGASRAASAATSAALELETAKSMRKLRRRLNEMWESHGMKAAVRPITLERWRWAAKWEEEQAAAAGSTKKAKAANNLHPVLPSKPTPEADKELILELERQGLSADKAKSTVAALHATSTTQAALLLKLQHQARSGRELTAPTVTLHAHKHTVDLVCGRTQVKLTWCARAKRARAKRARAKRAHAKSPPLLSHTPRRPTRSAHS